MVSPWDYWCAKGERDLAALLRLLTSSSVPILDTIVRLRNNIVMNGTDEVTNRP